MQQDDCLSRYINGQTNLRHLSPLIMSSEELHHEFEKDENFMRFLRELEPDWPDWWETEYSGHLKGMYRAYIQGKIDAASELKLEVETKLTQRTL